MRFWIIAAYIINAGLLIGFFGLPFILLKEREQFPFPPLLFALYPLFHPARP